MPTKRKNMKGKGIVDDGIRFIRDQKLISKGLGLIPHPAGQIAAIIANQLGLGKRKRKRKTPTKMMGKGIFSDIGGGIGNVFGGLGSGVGSIAHGLFGQGKGKKCMPSVIMMKH